MQQVTVAPMQLPAANGIRADEPLANVDAGANASVR